MTSETTQRAGGACGVVFVVGLLVGSSAGGYAGTVVALTALVLFVPFLAALISILRHADGGGWISTTAFAAGLSAIVIKLVSATPEIAQRDIAADSPSYYALERLGDAAFVVGLYPLAVFFAATATLIVASGLLPRWLGASAAVTSAAQAVNAAFIDASFGPAFLVYLAWTLAASIVLLRARGASPARGLAVEDRDAAVGA